MWTCKWADQLGIEIKDFNENEREEVSKFDTNVHKLNQEIKTDGAERESKIRESLSLLVDKLSFVQGELYSERKNREEAYDAMIKRIGNEILRVNKVITSERKNREESHADLMRLLNDAYNKFMAEIDVG